MMLLLLLMRMRVNGRYVEVLVAETRCVKRLKRQDRQLKKRASRVSSRQFCRQKSDFSIARPCTMQMRPSTPGAIVSISLESNDEAKRGKERTLMRRSRAQFLRLGIPGPHYRTAL